MINLFINIYLLNSVTYSINLFWRTRQQDQPIHRHLFTNSVTYSTRTNLLIYIYLLNSVTYSRWTWYQPIDHIYLFNTAMKSSSCTDTHLNSVQNRKRKMTVWEQLFVVFVSNWINAQCILVRWKRGSSQRRALWSAENEALPQRQSIVVRWKRG